MAEWRALRARLELPQEARGDAAAEAVAAQQGMSAAQLAALVRRCAERYEAKRTDAGARSQKAHTHAWFSQYLHAACLLADALQPASQMLVLLLLTRALAMKRRSRSFSTAPHARSPWVTLRE